MAMTKVLISVDEDDLRRIDEHAERAQMSRAAYLVALGREGSGAVRVFDAIDRVEKSLSEFKAAMRGAS